MTRIRAAVSTAVGAPLDVVNDVEISEPRVGEVLVRVKNCGICHSDLSVIDGGGPTPIVLGHEAAGVVEAVGEGVARVRPGDSVMLTPLGSCGRCYYCVRSEFTLCVEAQAFMTGLFADGTSPLSRGGELVFQGLGVGGFGDHTLVPERNVVKIPDDTPLDVACVIGCAVQTGVGAVLNTAAVEEGATVLVMGLGGIGVSVVQGARLAGASRIIVSDPVGERRDAAANFGATDVLDPGEDDVAARARELTGGIGVDYAFDAAGVAALVEVGLVATRPGGTTVMVGAPGVDQNVTISPAVLHVVQEKKLLGSLLGSANSHHEVPRLLALWRNGRLDLESMVSHRLDLADINAGLDHLRAGRGIRTVLTL